MRRVQKNSFIANQRGFADLIPIAIALPIALGLLAAIVDYSRVPAARQTLSTVLSDAANSVERKLSEDASEFVVDQYPAAGNSLCDFVAPGQGHYCTNPGARRSGVINPGNSFAYVNTACEIAVSKLSQPAGIFSLGGDLSDVSVAFVMVRLRFDESSGQALGVEGVARSQDLCGGQTRSASEMATRFNFSANEAADKLLERLRAQGDGAGAWKISTDNQANNDYTRPQRPWLDSVWMIGVAYLDVKHMLGVFTGPDDSIVDYVIRPMNSPVGFDRG